MSNVKGKAGTWESDSYFVQIMAVTSLLGGAGQVTTLL